MRASSFFLKRLYFFDLTFNKTWICFHSLLQYRYLHQESDDGGFNNKIYSSPKSFDRFLTKEPIFSIKTQSEGHASDFIDYCNVHCVSGDGGDGYLSFLREYKLPYGGADGGNGGNGGHIIFKGKICLDVKLWSINNNF